MATARFWVCGLPHPSGSWKRGVTGDAVWESSEVLKPQSTGELQGKAYGTRREEGKMQTLGAAGVMAEAGLVSSPMDREERKS